jgi:lipopolysaccharide transport system ATP-binding protein
VRTPAIRAERLGKRYRIRRRRQPGTARDAIAAACRRLVNLAGHRADAFESDTSVDDHVWALQDLSLEIAAGERVGILGRNGAGKSTLLKVLARVTDPTNGFAEVTGRVGSLLEVGTGFHGDLTGRENTYLNGAILGMNRAEIATKFDEMVAFAGIERFIDTPVKYYSSGMYMRLAFAVAAHLDSEILLVDEVLAVGDAAFQQKCLAKMDDIARAGRTVLFISHNLDTIRRFCSRGVLLEQGSLVADGPMPEVVARYTTLLMLPEEDALAVNQ